MKGNNNAPLRSVFGRMWGGGAGEVAAGPHALGYLSAEKEKLERKKKRNMMCVSFFFLFSFPCLRVLCYFCLWSCDFFDYF